MPVFYWPMLATDLNEPTFYIRRARFKHDNVFGTQVLTNWNGYQLLGIRNKPDGHRLRHQPRLPEQARLRPRRHVHLRPRRACSAFPATSAGLVDYWGIQDSGIDNLGRGRTRRAAREVATATASSGSTASCSPTTSSSRAETRLDQRPQLPRRVLQERMGRAEGRDHRHRTEAASPTTRSWSISADYRLNDFFTQTDWLPRADHFWLGQSLFNDAFTWYEHSSVGYAQFRRRRARQPPVGPARPTGPFNYLPWEAAPTRRASGSPRGRRSTGRSNSAPVKVVPYALGEAAHWGEDINGNALDRLFGQAGVRASLPMWSVDPTVDSDLLNVHGLAHKVDFDVEFAYADANQRPGRPAAVRSAGRRLDRGLPAAVRDQHVRRPVDARRRRSPPGRLDSAAVRRAALRPADRPAELGHLAEHRNRRRPDGRPPRARNSAGRPSAARPTTGASSTGSRSTPTSRSSPTPTATTSARRPGCWTTTSAGTSATG